VGPQRPDPGATRRLTFGPLLAVVVAAGVVVRIGYDLLVDVRLGFDAVWYQFQAGNLADGRGYVDPQAAFERGVNIATANFPPLWPGLLSLANRAGWDTELSYQVVGAIVGAVTVLLTGLLGRRCFGPRAGLVGAAIVAVSPPLVIADASLMADSLFVMLIALALLIAVDASADRASWGGGWWPWIALGTVLGLATLTRSDGLLLAPFIVGGAWLARGPSRAQSPASGAPARSRPALGALAAVVTLVVVLVPWTVSRSRALDTLVVVSSNSGSLLEGANCAETYGGPGIGSWDAQCLGFTRDPELTEAESASRARDAGITYARDHWTRLPVVGTVRVLRTWGFYDPIDQARIEAVESRGTGWQVGAWVWSLVLLAVATYGAIRARSRWRELAPLLAVVLGVTVVALLSWGNSRFRLAAEPVLAVYAAAAALSLPRRRRREVPASGGPGG
jgi:4-amino-4-deoxy-L-arabinose transferase-like glycosyltransferase